MEDVHIRGTFAGGTFVINGRVAPQYKHLLAVFQGHFEDGIEDCAQLCVFVRGYKVIDIWGNIDTDPQLDDTQKEAKPPARYGPDSLQNVFSCSKAITSLVVAMMVDKKHIEYESTAASIFPEYKAYGKEKTTISHIMRHEAGLQTFKTPLVAEDLTTKRIKEGSLSSIVAKQVPNHPPGAKRCYHGLTRGFIINEITRRADPQKRTVAEFLRDEIVIPLGLEDEMCIGLPDKLHKKVAPLTGLPMPHYVLQFIKGARIIPRQFGSFHAFVLLCVAFLFDLVISIRSVFCGAKPGSLLQSVQGIQISSNDAAAQLSSKKGIGEIAPHWRLHLMQPQPSAAFWGAGPKFFNLLQIQQAELPSTNCHATGRALATLAALIVEGGALPLPALNARAGIQLVTFFLRRCAGVHPTSPLAYLLPSAPTPLLLPPAYYSPLFLSSD
jgi:hypothetical protein